MDTINIPAQKPPPDPYMEGLINIIRQCGMDPRKAIVNGPPMFAVCCQSWRQGEMDEASLRRCLKNLLVMNPSLAL